MNSQSKTSESSEGINLFFGKLPKSGLLEKSDESSGSLKFIILQNDQLHQKIEEVKELNKELQDQVDELESSNDSLEKTRKCLQGYVKNEHQIGQAYKKLHMMNFKVERILWSNLMFIWACVFLISLIDVWYVNFTLIASAGGYLYLSVFQRYSQEKKAERIKILKELAETEKANTYLDDLIDNL